MSNVNDLLTMGGIAFLMTENDNEMDLTLKKMAEKRFLCTYKTILLCTFVRKPSFRHCNDNETIFEFHTSGLKTDQRCTPPVP